MDEELFNELKTGGLHHEFDWFAFDKIGQVGIITSVFGAFVPEQIWKSYENYGTTLNYFLGLQPIKSHQEILDSVRGETDDWKEYAKTGLFAHDYNHENGCFELKAIPENPILKSDIKMNLGALNSMPTLNIEFGSTSKIANRDIKQLITY